MGRLYNINGLPTGSSSLLFMDISLVSSLYHVINLTILVVWYDFGIMIRGDLILKEDIFK